MTLRIAVPNKGRLAERALDLLRRAGLPVSSPDHRLVDPIEGGRLHVLFVRAQDIPGYVRSGSVDLGITGLDLVEEQGGGVARLLDLGFGRCRLTVASPRSAGIREASQIPEDARVATPFPNLARRYFRKLGKRVRLIGVSGATEVAPTIGVADCIVDLVETGSALREHNLVPLDVILESHAVLIGPRERKESRQVQDLVETFRSVMAASSKRYVMANVSESDLRRVIRLIPGLASPTVMKLSQEGMCAVHSVVDEDRLNRVLSDLRRAGASGILVLPIERLIP